MPDQTQDTGGAGHHWKDPDLVHKYKARMARKDEERQAIFELLCRLIPYDPNEPIRILDVGAGYGAVAKACLLWYPHAHLICLDVSEEMIKLGTQHLAEFAPRVTYVHGDFAGGYLPPTVQGSFHAIVSSLAIHHLTHECKQDLYRNIYQRLVPGGCFINVDLVETEDPLLAVAYNEIHRREDEAKGIPDTDMAIPSDSHDIPSPLFHQLTWLRDAGFMGVDCFWKRLDTAMYGGFKQE